MSRRDKNNRGRITQLRARKAFRRNVLRVLLRSLAWLGFAVLYYALFSLLFDTPYEFYLRNSSQRLHAEYDALERRYDSLEMVIANIEDRDRNIFAMLFESSPYTFEQGANISRAEIREANIGRSTSEMVAELRRRSGAFEANVDSLIYSTQRMVINIEHKGRSAANIPAIQPVANSQLTLLTASYGERIHPFYKALQPHLGVDYTVPEGTRVFATASGVIKDYTLSSSTTGKSITIDHGNGYETYYAHLEKIDIPRSRRVKRGDIIGMSGNTGLSLTPHLHYEVRYRGEKIDPINYLFMELNPAKTRQIQEIARSGMQSFD